MTTTRKTSVVTVTLREAKAGRMEPPRAAVHETSKGLHRCDLAGHVSWNVEKKYVRPMCDGAADRARTVQKRVSMQVFHAFD